MHQEVYFARTKQNKTKQNKKQNWRDKKKSAEMLSGFQKFFNG